MRVGLNAEPIFQRVPTGVGVYALELCRGLVEVGHAGDLVFFHAHHDDDAASGVDDLPVDQVEFTLARDRLYEAWMADRRPVPQSITGDLDVVHSVGPAIPPAGGAALVVTVHDLAPIRFADRYPRRARALHRRGAHIAAAEAARIIVPSRSTALDVEEFYEVERDRIRVVPHGVDIANLEPADDEHVGDAGRRWERRGIAGPYVLWVGTQEQRKNVVAVLDAFAHLASRHPELTLVLHGPNGWLGDEVGEGLVRRGLGGRTIVSEGSLPRTELAALYARASVFVYPSLYEGFGLPVLEAMACGTPVVTSNISALPETAGDAALLVDPLDDLALAEAIAHIVEDPDLAEDLHDRGRKRAKAFTWGETARRTWCVYEEARAVVS